MGRLFRGIFSIMVILFYINTRYHFLLQHLSGNFPIYGLQFKATNSDNHNQLKVEKNQIILFAEKN